MLKGGRGKGAGKPTFSAWARGRRVWTLSSARSPQVSTSRRAVPRHDLRWVRQCRSPGSVREATSNCRPYRDASRETGGWSPACGQAQQIVLAEQMARAQTEWFRSRIGYARRPIRLLFLSHSGADTAAAWELKRRILSAPAARDAGLQVWFDKDELRTGAVSWQQQLEEVIGRATAFCVYVGSQGVTNWVEREVRLGLSRATGEGAIPFIPPRRRSALGCAAAICAPASGHP